MMTDTMVPSSRKKENTSRVTVELLEDGQHPHKRHGADPHRQEALKSSPRKTKVKKTLKPTAVYK